MVYLATILVFVLVVFFYMHINHQRKIVNDKEIATLNINSSRVLDEVCELRVPFLFSRNVVDFQSIGLNYEDVKLNETGDYIYVNEVSGNTITKQMKSWKWLVSNLDSNAISTAPPQLVNHSMFDKINRKYKTFWSPYMSVHDDSRIIIGNNRGTEGYTQSSACRRYVTCLDGTAEIRLVLPDTIDKRSTNDFSTIGPDDYVKVVLKPGNVVSIPPYWWTAILTSEKTVIMEQNYRSIINILANLDTLVISFLRKLNVEKKISSSKETLSEGVLSSVSKVE
tara:strand:+ start:3264 stop:4106 length:843 start_codon:yes stop_codon:yes gene_type:complete